MARLRDLCARGEYAAFVGLTGGLASGKSSVLEVLRSAGAITVNADLIAHSAYARDGGPAYAPLVAAFGQGILGPGGEVDRKALGAAVFGSDEARARLQAIVWPATASLAVASFLSQAAAAPALAPGAPPRVGVLEAALLVEAGWDASVDEVWLCVPGLDAGQADEEAVRRAVARSGGAMTEGAARARLAAQMPREALLRHPAVSTVIDTSGPVEATRAAVLAAWAALLERHGGQRR